MTPKKKETIKITTQILLIMSECVAFPILGTKIYDSEHIEICGPIYAVGIFVVLITGLWIVIDNRKEEP